jgi:hypothetical protein
MRPPGSGSDADEAHGIQVPGARGRPHPLAVAVHDPLFAQPFERDSDRLRVDVVELALELPPRPALCVIVAQQLQYDQTLRTVVLQRIDLRIGHTAFFGPRRPDPADNRLSWREKTQNYVGDGGGRIRTCVGRANRFTADLL